MGRYWQIIDKIGKFSLLDICGGIIIGIGMNILAALLVTKKSSLTVSNLVGVFWALGFILGGLLMSLGRIMISEVRIRAIRAADKMKSNEYNMPLEVFPTHFELIKNAYKATLKKSRFAILSFCTGLTLSVILFCTTIISIFSNS